MHACYPQYICLWFLLLKNYVYLEPFIPLLFLKYRNWDLTNLQVHDVPPVVLSIVYEWLRAMPLLAIEIYKSLFAFNLPFSSK